jgi:predicted nucleic acid-binding protein
MKARLFLDSSALVAGIASSTGAARALLVMAEAGGVSIILSEQVVAETERAIARKIPEALPDFRAALRSTGMRIVRDPSPGEVAAHTGVIAHQSDVPVIVAAMKAGVDYLVTLDRRHFLDDPAVAKRSGLRIGTPHTALTWLRNRMRITDGM